MFASEWAPAVPEDHVRLCILADDPRGNQLVTSLLRSAGDGLGTLGHTEVFSRDQLARVRDGKNLDADGGQVRHYKFGWMNAAVGSQTVDVTLTRGPVRRVIPHMDGATSLLVLADDLPASRSLTRALRSVRCSRVVVIGRRLRPRLSDALRASGADIRNATADPLMLNRAWRFLCGEDVPLPLWRADGSVSHVGLSMASGRPKTYVAAAVLLIVAFAVAVAMTRSTDAPPARSASLDVGLLRLSPQRASPGDTLEFEVPLAAIADSPFTGIVESILIEGSGTTIELVPFDLPGATIRPGETVRRGRVILPAGMPKGFYHFIYTVRIGSTGDTATGWRAQPVALDVIGEQGIAR